MSNSNYNRLKQLLSEVEDISKAMSVLNWDQEVNIPPKGISHRAQQIGTLAGISHEKFTSKELENLVHKLQKEDLPFKEKRNVEETSRDLKKAKSYTKEFVVKSSQVTSQALNAWNKAKAEKDFSIFKNDLQNIVELKKEEADLLGFERHPYNALIDIYEPNTTIDDLDVIFDKVKTELSDFAQEIFDRPKPNDQFLYKQYNKDLQIDFSKHLLKQMGYDFEAGKLDISSHPFSTSFSPLDSRITTRVDENYLFESISSSIHEGGHALYEQGLGVEDYGLASGNYLSLGIHESQSRLYENNVGRSLAYWKANFNELKSIFSSKLEKVALQDFYKAINIVQPSLIRTASDELTYHFHVLIRYEIEKALIEGSLNVDDVPAFWNDAYKKYLNIEPQDDSEGVLQDIHWSHGSFGYFPTYSLGSFYAAQFYQTAIEQNDDIANQIERGNMKPLLTWLRENIHQHGRLYSSKELCKKVTGEELNFSYFMNYVKRKYSDLYNL